MRRRLARAAAQTLEEVLLLLNKSTMTTMGLPCSLAMKAPSAAAASSSSFSSCFMRGSSRFGACVCRCFEIEQSLRSWKKKSKRRFVCSPQIDGVLAFFFFLFLHEHGALHASFLHLFRPLVR
jgi:hypothetical protein